MPISKGRIVFYTRHFSDAGVIVEELVAVVTSVNADGTVQLRVFAEVGEDMRLMNVKAGPNEGREPADRCWSWPPKVA